LLGASLCAQGWCVNLVLKRKDFPWLADDMAALAQLRQARHDEIQRYLTSLQ
jgi:hypothetical protein